LILTGPANIELLGSHFEYTTDPDWQLKVEDFTGALAGRDGTYAGAGARLSATRRRASGCGSTW
jgi:hypothetical protein